MSSDLRQLVCEIAELTGVDPPALLAEDSPTLSADALDSSPQEPYLISLIGGKDVGKSSLVNAIAGREITPHSSHGPGTESVIAYVHESQCASVRALLDNEAPGQHRLIPHSTPHLTRQVLLDLPDIDSHYASHIELTRRMLRHTLYPIFLQSVEKYADHRPRELLSLVATGNNPENFIFVLNKADQLIAREGEAAARELAADYAQRLQRTLNLKEAPKVWLISAIHPDRHDLPALRKLLSQQRTEDSVAASLQLASHRQGLSLADWVERQQLDQRLAAMQRLQSAAEDELASRISLPLIQSAVPKILEDPAYRLALADSLMDQRVTRWPIVNIFHVLLSPLLSLMRRRLPLPQQAALQGPVEMVNIHLQAVPSLQPAAAAQVPGSAALDTAQPLAQRIQSTFALLHQS
jgi:GTPase Era involved in 16S rRNA processing